MTDPAARPALWMLAGALAFAAMGALTYALGSRCDWLLIALVRAVFMFSTTTLLAKAAGVRLVVFEPPTLWVRSLAGSFSLVCNFFAMTRLPVADVLTLTNTYPLWIVLLTALLFRQPPTIGEMAGMISGLAGVALIQQPHLGGDRWAAGVALLGSISTAVAMLGLHRLRGIDARAIVAHFAGVATLVAGAWLLLRRGSLAAGMLPPSTWLLLLAVGVSGTIGQFFLTRAYAAGAPARVSVIGLSQVVFGMGLDVAIWGRTLSPTTLAGIALVLAPTAWMTLRAGRKLAAVATPRPIP
ncbi:MAG: DMT family transporter [Isosphaeraceae bacterium]|nr:DMT family transporter [Isosphaeraceae bacterium]